MPMGAHLAGLIDHARRRLGRRFLVRSRLGTNAGKNLAAKVDVRLNPSLLKRELFDPRDTIPNMIILARSVQKHRQEKKPWSGIGLPRRQAASGPVAVAPAWPGRVRASKV